MNEDVGAEGEIVNLTAAITYGNYKEEHIHSGACVSAGLFRGGGMEEKNI